VSRVVLFHTCLVNELAPAVGMAVVHVLERLGCTVVVPRDQTCCGQPAFNAGFHDEAAIAARHTISLLERTDGPIIIPSGSCGDMLTHQYLRVLADDVTWHARATAIAGRCVEFGAFVAAHLERLRPGTVRGRVAYHPSCHLARGLGVDAEPRAVLASIPGVEVTPIAAEDECCGFGGLFSIKYDGISARIMDRKVANIAACGADRLVSCDMGCLLHLEGGLHRQGVAIRVQHLAELIEEATR
jgi:L-lactate dehydrogenase complex protein LldE